MRISQIISLLLIVSLLGAPYAGAADTETDFNATRTHVNTIQAVNPSLPTNVPQQRGSIGEIVSRLFDSNGKIGNWYLKVLGTRSDNAVLKWSGGNGGQLVEGLIFDDGTNVGIGVSNPNRALHIRKPGSDSLAIHLQDNDASWFLTTTTDEGFGIYEGSTATSGARLNITSAGNIGIGDTNPGYKLDVSGDINFTGEIRKNGVIYNPASKWIDGTNPLDASFMTGDVGVGTLTPGEALSVVGRISSTVDPNSDDDIGDRGYNDARYINVGESGDSILDNTIDGSEIQDGTINAIDLNTNAVTSAKILDGEVTSADINNNTITETDIIDTFVARNSNLLDGIDSENFLRSNVADTMSAKLTLNNSAYNNHLRFIRSGETWDVTPSTDGSLNFVHTAGGGQNRLEAPGLQTTGDIESGRQFTGGFGAITTSGTTDWNHSTNARAGNGYTLLLGNATNGPGVGGYYHPFSFEYNSKNGTGNMTQFAVPYASTAQNQGMFLRTRYSGTWQPWSKMLIENTSGNVNITGNLTLGGNLSGDSITDETIDSSEIQNNTLTANDLAPNSVGNSELIDTPTFTNTSITASAPILNFTETDQADPAGRWRLVADGGSFNLRRRTAAGTWTGENYPISVNNVGNVSIGGGASGEKLHVIGRLSLTTDPNSGNDVGDRDYNDARYINVGESGDSIQDNTIDSSEIQDNTIAAIDIAADAIGGSELANNSVASANIISGAIVNSDVNNSAAIAGTKISPNFGNQNILTQGALISNRGTNIGQQMERGTSTETTLRFDSDRYRLYAGGTGGSGEVFSVLESGNIGIGNTGPSNKLHVTGNIGATGWIGSGCESACEGGGGYAIMYGNGDIHSTGNYVSPGQGTIRDSGGGWVRTYGNTGWYSQTYGGGIYMTDTTWLRAFNGKSFYTTNAMRADNGFQVDGTTVVDGSAWIIGDRIQQGSVDGSEIQDGTIASADITNNTITETDIADSFKARDADLLDGIDQSGFIRSNANDNVTAHTEWQDNYEVRLGSGADMRLFHNGTNSYIRNYNGNMELRNLSHGSSVYVQGSNNSGTNRTMLSMDPDNYVRLYYAGSERVRTHSSGLQLQGATQIDNVTCIGNCF